jgi:hypothetical protein
VSQQPLARRLARRLPLEQMPPSTLTGHLLLHGVPPPDFCTPTIHIHGPPASADDEDREADEALDSYERREKDPLYIAYKRWRNRVRQFDPRVLFDLAINELQTVPLGGEDAAKRLPSLTCLLVKWLLQDVDLDAIGQRRIPTELDLQRLRQHLWDLQEEVDFNHFGSTGLYFTIRRMFHAQYEFQRRVDRGLFRDVGLIMALPVDHPLRRMARDVLGLELPSYVGLCLWLIALIGQGHRVITPTQIGEATLLFGVDDVARFLELVAPDLAGLRRLLRDRKDARRKVGSEMFETPALTHAPLLQVGNEAVVWHPTLVTRGLEVLLHRRLAAVHGARYMEAFSDLFESHVVDQARRTRLPTYDEDTVASWLPPGSKVIDAVLEIPRGTILVEAKASLYDEEIMSCGDPEWFARNTRPLRAAIEQLQTVAGLLPDADLAPPGVKTGALFGVVVTNLELRVGSAARLASMYPPGKLTPRTHAHELGAGRLPLECIYIVGAAAYDRLTEALRRETIDAVAFLEDCISRDQHGATARMGLDHHLDDARVPHFGSRPARYAETVAMRRVRAAARSPSQPKGARAIIVGPHRGVSSAALSSTRVTDAGALGN